MSSLNLKKEKILTRCKYYILSITTQHNLKQKLFFHFNNFSDIYDEKNLKIQKSALNRLWIKENR